MYCMTGLTSLIILIYSPDNYVTYNSGGLCYVIAVIDSPDSGEVMRKR